MTYKRAMLIKDLVDNLNDSFASDYFSAAIVQDFPDEDFYSVHLFSNADNTGSLCRLAAFASSIENLSCGIIVRLDSYNKGTTETDMVPSIRIH